MTNVNVIFFKEAKIVNFDIIHRECCREEVLKDLLKYYQTVNDESVSKYLAIEQNKILSSAFRTDREDILLKKKLKKKHINKKIKSKTVLLSANSF